MILPERPGRSGQGLCRLLGGTAVAKLAGMAFLVTPGSVTRRVTWRVIIAALCAGTVAAGTGLTGTAQQPTFRSGTQFVPLFTTVTDAQGRLVPDLDRDQFTVLDNGKVQNLTVFENETQPFTAVIMMDFSASMTANLDRLKDAAEQFLIRMLPADKAQVGAFSDKIQFSGTFTSDRDDLIGALQDLQFGNPTRLYDAIWESIDMLDGIEGRKVVVAFTDGDDTASRRGMGAALDYARLKEVMIYSDRDGVGVLQRPACHENAARPRPEEAVGGNRRRLLRAEEVRRARPDLHPRGAGAAQPLHHRLQPPGARRQGAQARGADEAAGHDRPGAQELHRAGRASLERQVTEQEFRLRADQALEELQHGLLPLADEAGLEIDLRNGVLQVVFEEPEPAKFVISPNAPVQQIWVSARSRSYKLAWSDDAGTFVLDGEQLNTLVERLAQQQLTGN